MLNNRYKQKLLKQEYADYTVVITTWLAVMKYPFVYQVDKTS